MNMVYDFKEIQASNICILSAHSDTLYSIPCVRKIMRLSLLSLKQVFLDQDTGPFKRIIKNFCKVGTHSGMDLDPSVNDHYR